MTTAITKRLRDLFVRHFPAITYFVTPDARKQTGTEAGNLTDGKNALIITDAGVVKAGLLDDIEASLANEGFAVSVCATVAPEPAVSDYETVLEMAAKGIHAVLKLIDDVGGPTRISDIETASKNDIPEMVHLYRTNPNIVEFFEEWCKREMPTEAEATALFEDMFEPEFNLP